MTSNAGTYNLSCRMVQAGAAVLVLAASCLVDTADAAGKIKLLANRGKLDRMTFKASGIPLGATDPATEETTFFVSNTESVVYQEALVVGSLVANGAGTRWRYRAVRNGVDSLVYRLNVREKATPDTAARTLSVVLKLEADLVAADPVRSGLPAASLARMHVDIAFGDDLLFVETEWNAKPSGWSTKARGLRAASFGPPRRVFLSSQCYVGDLAGVGGADANCQALADAALLAGTFKAWLSDVDNGPASRFVRHAGPYSLVDGTLVAAGWEDLTDGVLAAPIRRDEVGVAPGPAAGCDGDVWTNTSVGGSPLTDGFEFACQDWTSALFARTAMTGDASLADIGWTDGGELSVRSCNSAARLYCFEQ